MHEIPTENEKNKDDDGAAASEPVLEVKTEGTTNLIKSGHTYK